MLADQIMKDIEECESRYQKSGNLSKEYPWYLLKARAYCLKRMLMEGIIEGLFEKEKYLLVLCRTFHRTKIEILGKLHPLRRIII